MSDYEIKMTQKAYQDKINDARAHGAAKIKLGVLEYVFKEVTSGRETPELMRVKDKVVEIVDDYVRSLGPNIT